MNDRNHQATLFMIRDRIVIHEQMSVRRWTQAKKARQVHAAGMLSLEHYDHKEAADILREALGALESLFRPT